MVTKSERYLGALYELQNSDIDIVTSSIVTLDGLTMASTAKENESKDAFAAYSAASYRRSDETMQELSGENANLLIFESKNQRMFSIRAGRNALIIVLTGIHSDIGKIVSELRKTARKVEDLIK